MTNIEVGNFLFFHSNVTLLNLAKTVDICKKLEYTNQYNIRLIKDSYVCLEMIYRGRNCMNLRNAELEKEYIIHKINTDDEELNAFLFSLGCYSGEPITVMSRLKSSCIVSIKDARYNIDNELAEAILV